MYQEKSFTLPDLAGLSVDQIQVHLGLYSGYVKNVNALQEKIATLSVEGGDAVILAELQRRLGFEFNGMRMHEYYFEQLEGGSSSVQGTDFEKHVINQFGSFEEYLADLRRVAGMRGIGWVVTYYDPKVQIFVNSWVSDHELGQLAGLHVVFALDMWEHAYMVDYLPATKGDYVTQYLKLVNWDVVDQRIS